MSNLRDYAARMIRNLAASFGRHISDATLEMYVEKLSKHWNLPEENWARATSRIIAELEIFPSIAVVNKYLASSIIRTGIKQDDRYWVAFKLDGKDYAIQCANPANPPMPPANASDLHLVIPPDEQVHFDRVSQSEARECFRTGYLESGGKPERMHEFFGAAIARPTRDRKPMWYDEKDEVTF